MHTMCVVLYHMNGETRQLYNLVPDTSECLFKKPHLVVDTALRMNLNSLPLLACATQ